MHRNGERLLWNPLVKKAFKNLPEERVRLQTLEFLLHAARWPAGRISCESAVRSNIQSENSLRTDLVCYNRDYKPAVLIECKAPNIRLSEKTAHQIAGYNRSIKAPFLFMTNGISDMYFEIDHKTENVMAVDRIKLFPDINLISDPPPLTFFLERGFAGRKTSPEIRSWLVRALPAFMKLQAMETRFLDLGVTLEQEPVNHYYRIFKIDDHKKMALTFIGTRFEDTRVIAVLNEGGKNKGLLEINLELIQKKVLYSAILYHPEGVMKIGTKDLFNFREFSGDQIRELPGRISEKIITGK